MGPFDSEESNKSIVEAENVFEERFALETAICTQESLGMIVAVHEVERVEDDMCFVTFSTRASEDTIRRHGPIRSIENGRHKNGSVAYGDFNFYMPGKRVGENEWQAPDRQGTSGEGFDVATLELTGRQRELVEAVHATGTPTVVVLINGRDWNLHTLSNRRR